MLFKFVSHFINKLKPLLTHNKYKVTKKVYGSARHLYKHFGESIIKQMALTAGQLMADKEIY